jgi:hypothetical protein
VQFVVLYYRTQPSHQITNPRINFPAKNSYMVYTVYILFWPTLVVCQNDTQLLLPRTASGPVFPIRAKGDNPRHPVVFHPEESQAPKIEFVLPHLHPALCDLQPPAPRTARRSRASSLTLWAPNSRSSSRSSWASCRWVGCAIVLKRNG